MDLFLNERVLCINHKYIVSYKSGYIYIRNSQKKDIIISRIKLTKKLLTKIPIVTRLM